MNSLCLVISSLSNLEPIFRVKDFHFHFVQVKYQYFFCNEFGCKLWLQSIQNLVGDLSKILRAPIWSGCTVQLESEHTIFSLTGRQFRSSSLHMIQFSTCRFAPMPYSYSCFQFPWFTSKMGRHVGALDNQPGTVEPSQCSETGSIHTGTAESWIGAGHWAKLGRLAWL